MAVRIYDRYGNIRTTSPAPQAGPQVGGHTGGSGLSRLYVPGMLGGTALTTGAPAAGTMRAVPFRCPNRRGTIDLLAIQVTTLLAGSARVGLFRNADKAGQNLYPGALIVDSGVLDTTTTGLKSAAVSATYDPGELLWAVHVSSVAATLRCMAIAGIDTSVLGLDTALGTAGGLGISVAHAFAALPATFTAGGAVITAVPIPAIGVRFAS